MPSTVINAKQAEDPRDVIHRAVAALSAGQILALPTETVYGLAASALNEAAVKRLYSIKDRDPRLPLALAIKGADDALDYVPDMGLMERRLTRRCWPGPVTLVMDGSHPDSVITRLPQAVQQAVKPDRFIGLRVTAHELFQQTLRLLAGPLVLTSANRSGQQELLEPATIAEEFDGEVDLVIDAGRCRYGQSSTVARVDRGSIEILREGVVSKMVLDDLSGFSALIVCTGNTCRSPMAEMLFKKELANRLGCEVMELEQRGVRVASAGIAAMPGGSPSPEAETVMGEFGIDLSQHRSQPVTDRLTRQADLILTMTEGHRFALVSHWPEVSTRTHLLRKDGQDVTDPIGYSAAVYKKCADQIAENVKQWVDELDLKELGILN